MIEFSPSVIVKGVDKQIGPVQPTQRNETAISANQTPIRTDPSRRRSLGSARFCSSPLVTPPVKRVSDKSLIDLPSKKSK